MAWGACIAYCSSMDWQLGFTGHSACDGRRSWRPRLCSQAWTGAQVVRPLDDSAEAAHTAAVVNELSAVMRGILEVLQPGCSGCPPAQSRLSYMLCSASDAFPKSQTTRRATPSTRNGRARASRQPTWCCCAAAAHGALPEAKDIPAGRLSTCVLQRLLKAAAPRRLCQA